MPIGQTSGISLKCRIEHAGVRVGTFAAQLVEAPAVTMSVVAEDLREAAVVEVRAPRTLLVNQAVVRELRTEIAVQFGQRAGAHELQHRAHAGCKDSEDSRAS